MVKYLQQIVRHGALTVALLLVLSHVAIDYVDARPQLSPIPSFSAGNGTISCQGVRAQILAETPSVRVHGSCTKSIRAVRVCNTLVVHHECKNNHQCPRPTTATYDFSCLRKNLACGFTISCCEN